MDLRSIVSKQTSDHIWGNYATGLMNENFRTPRAGQHNDRAHPPIHPVNYVARESFGSDDERRVYEFVVRRFLACCSEDAKGESTIVTIRYGSEVFTANGLIVLQRNYLDVYPYDRWESSQPLPAFAQGETLIPSEARMNEGKTTAPGYLTESELIALMDANGIGTDATMAEHIAKIKERAYVMTQSQGNQSAGAGASSDNEYTPAARGGRGRGRGRGRGGRGGAGSGGRGGGGGNEIFIPTTLGVALIEGYDNIGFATSVSKPFLRKEVRKATVEHAIEHHREADHVQMELRMKAICNGTETKSEVVQTSLEQYREVYIRTVQQMSVLQAVRSLVF